MEDRVILVDEHDNELGVLDKLLAHRTGVLHRAFSVFVFNSRGELLLQQRADGKYHSGGLWSNTCCSHPREGEETADAASRRLREEMGMVCDTVFQFRFIYRVDFDNGLTEHELDHVYFGTSDAPPVPDDLEVKAWKYLTLEQLEKEIRLYPQYFTAWLRICLPEVIDHCGERYKL